MGARCSLGVYFDDSLLQLVYLRAGLRGWEVAGCASIPLPPSKEEEGPFFQEVQKFLLRNGVRSTDPIVAGIPRAHLLFREFTTPAVKEKELAELVNYECERHLPGLKDDFIVGFQRMKRLKEGGHQVLLAAARRDALQGRLALLRRANLAPFSLQPVSIALTCLFRRSLPDAEPSLLLSIERDAFTVDYIAEGRLLFSRYFRTAALEESDADSRTGEHEGDRADRRGRERRRMAAAVGEKLSTPLFLESLPDKRLPPLWVHGPGTNDGVIVEKLQDELRVSARPWPFPVQAYSLENGLEPELLGPPLGLALLGLEGGKEGLEMSEEEEGTLRTSPRYRFTAVLAVVLLVFLSVRYGVDSHYNRRRLTRLDREIAQLVKAKSAVEVLSRSVEEERTRFTYLGDKIGGRMRQADLLKELTSLIPESAYLSDYTFRQGRVEIGGLAPSSSSLLPILEASPLFRAVEFYSDIVSHGKDLERFKIRLYLEEQGGPEEDET